MRTLAISDIHGCLDPLKKMIEIIKPTPEDHLIFVGDYVDRGPNSKGVTRRSSSSLISTRQT